MWDMGYDDENVKVPSLVAGNPCVDCSPNNTQTEISRTYVFINSVK